MRAGTALALITISLAAVAGVAYGSYRANADTDRLQTRVAVLEESSRRSSGEIALQKAGTKRLCVGVDHVREKITGVVLTPGSPTPEFDIDAAPLNDAERIVLMLYNWCRASG